jgi:branched-chain amino acid transport system ATP-binding protein
MNGSIIDVENVTVRFGGIVALDDVSLTVARGSIRAVIGPNGAGKSTLLNVISGLYSVTDGRVSFEQERIDGLSPHEITRRGIARTFQNTELFGEMSALENVMVGLDLHHSYSLLSGMVHDGRYGRTEATMRHKAHELLDHVGLADDATIAAAALPFGKQRRLELARALATRPKLLLVDEPAAGLRAAEIEALNSILIRLRAEHGISILIIDHVMALVMAISDQITVLNFGRKIAEGDPKTVRKSPEVIKAYLGEKAAHALGS